MTMIKVLSFLVVVLVLGFGFAWLADRPGDLVVTFAGMQHKVSLMVAASAIVALVAAVMLVWWIIKSVIGSPYALRRHFRARKRDRGYQSLSTGLIAAGAGDGQTARRMIKQAEKLLNDCYRRQYAEAMRLLKEIAADAAANPPQGENIPASA